MVLAIVAAYFLVGTFCHWVLVRVDERWELVNHELARTMARDANGKTLFALAFVPGHIAYTATKLSKKHLNANGLSPFARFDAAANFIRNIWS